MPAVAKLPDKVPTVYFQPIGGSYWLSLPSGKFIALGKADASLHVRQAGVSGEKERKSGELSDLERVFLVAQSERALDYAGPLSGHEQGSYRTADGKLILVTRSVLPCPAGKPKDTPFLDRFLVGLLGGDEQLLHVLYWLKISHASMLRRIFQPGQALALAGPSNCGKSFFQVLVTELLGGRAEKCFDYMSAATTFNRELAEAEHWMIEDETASSQISKRRDFGNKIKQATVNPLLRVHGKGLTGITLATWRRLTISLNDEAENLMILPPMDGSLHDKLMLLKCSMATLSADRKENMERLRAELPSFVANLQRLRIPKRFQCPRMGVTSYHHPELLEALNEVAPETRLLSLIDHILHDEWRLKGPWDGSAEELEHRLRSSTFSYAVERLLYYSSACGVYLQRLQLKCPRRFEARKVKGKTRWIIREP